MRKSHVTFFLFPTLIALLMGGFFLFAYSKEYIHLAINANHAAWADILFKYWTYLGEGWLFALAIPVALFISWRASLQVALTGLFTLLVTGVFKNWLYAGEPRPVQFFSGIQDLNLVEGVKMAHWNSFPSGHTMAAFGIWFGMSIVLKNKTWSLIFFCIAFLVGYSRMYLNQHFLVDVVAGAGFGVFCALLAWWASNQFKGDFWNKPAWNKQSELR